MTKVSSFKIGDYVGTVYLAKLGYTYKVRYHRQIVDLSYVYLKDKELAIERMKNSVRYLANFRKDLFDEVKE